MLRAVIVEDEASSINRLTKLLNAHLEQVQVVGIHKSVEQAIQNIPKLSPDVVFLDVHLADKTGFDLLKALKTIDFAVVFTTAFDQYAIKAFKFSALDYLLKPIDPDDLSGAIAKLKERLSLHHISDKVETLFHNLNVNRTVSKKIAIPTMEGLILVFTTQIIRCQADVNYTEFLLEDHSKLKVSKTLKYFEDLLEEYGFMRIHNSHLINLEHVVKYTKGKGGFVTMADGSEVEVSIRKKALLLKRLGLGD